MNYPGTIVEYAGKSGREFLDGTFLATSGLVMQQVSEISGLAAPAVQNWVSRGFIAHPVNRKYDKNALARILIINTLREALSLEDIKRLLTFVNGSPESRLDDIIPESELYSYICDAVFDKKFGSDTIYPLVEKCTANYSENIPGSKERLETALRIILEVFLAEKTLTAATDSIKQLPESNVLGERL